MEQKPGYEARQMVVEMRFLRSIEENTKRDRINKKLWK
jgi:hypothetical protein